MNYFNLFLDLESSLFCDTSARSVAGKGKEMCIYPLELFKFTIEITG